jgi:1-acyl-sn-glycerol-3-phosphate acyltransferase
LRFYRVFQWLLRVATRVFFRRIEIVGLGNLPADAGLIFCGNHPNSLLDPILITAHCGRIVHFAAKDTLFESPPVAFVLRRMGAVPVRRRADHPGHELANQDAFAALHQVLLEGRRSRPEPRASPWRWRAGRRSAPSS